MVPFLVNRAPKQFAYGKVSCTKRAKCRCSHFMDGAVYFSQCTQGFVAKSTQTQCQSVYTLPSRQLTVHWQPTMLNFHKESDFHLPQSQNCLLGGHTLQCTLCIHGGGSSAQCAISVPSVHCQCTSSVHWLHWAWVWVYTLRSVKANAEFWLIHSPSLDQHACVECKHWKMVYPS